MDIITNHCRTNTKTYFLSKQQRMHYYILTGEWISQINFDYDTYHEIISGEKLLVDITID
jgi:hypothetical protein